MVMKREKMFRLLNPIDSTFNAHRNRVGFAVACSGGYDSMAVLKFFCRGGWKPQVIHVDHGTGNSAAVTPVMKLVEEYGLNLRVYTINNSIKNPKESWEEFWRNQRMAIFNMEGTPPVITGHNLDDAMETWVFGAINGQPKLIPYNTGNIYRPFLLTKKSDLYDFAVYNDVPWFEDKSNTDTKYSRNRIRHNIIPEVFKVNPGFHTVILKKYLELYNV